MAAGRLTKRRRLRAGSLSATKRSYPTSEVRGSGLECQAEPAQEQPRGAALRPRSVAAGRRHPVSKVRGGGLERSYLASEASGGQEETLRIRDQGQPGEATSCPRPGVAAGRSNPRSGGCAGTGGPRGAIPR